MYKLLIFICFYWPLFFSCLQLQGIVTYTISENVGQLFAYLNVILIMVGVILYTKHIKKTSVTGRLWFIFYILYYSLGLLAISLNGFQTSLLATLVPVIYFTGFYFLLSNKEQFEMFFKVITVSFVVAALFTIILFKLNFDVQTNQVYPWKLDRAEGLYGDANNAALASILAYVLFDKLFQPKQFVFRVLKVFLLGTLFYSLVLTFSTTGLFVFTIVFFVTNYKFFKGLRMMLLVVTLPLFYIGIFILKSQAQYLGLSKAQTDKINNIINLLTLNFDEVDNSGRSDLIENILNYIYQKPFLGNGIDFSSAHSGHNTYVGIWVDAGLFTFIFFLFMLLYFFGKAMSLNSKIRFFSVSILIILYIFMISLQTVINQPYLIALFVFVCYIIDYSKVEKENAKLFDI